MVRKGAKDACLNELRAARARHSTEDWKKAQWTAVAETIVGKHQEREEMTTAQAQESSHASSQPVATSASHSSKHGGNAPELDPYMLLGHGSDSFGHVYACATSASSTLKAACGAGAPVAVKCIPKTCVEQEPGRVEAHILRTGGRPA